VNFFLKRGEGNTYNKLFLSCLTRDSLKTHRDSKETVLKFFENGVLKIEKESLEILPYDELDSPVFGSQITKRKVWTNDIIKSDFEKFLNNVAGEENIEAFMSAIGYLCSSYKSQALALAVILNDPSSGFGSANGGKGKGLIGKAVSNFVNMVRLDGKKFNAEDPFNLAPVKQDTSVIFIDDVKENFSFKSLFNVLTEDLEITRKHKDKITLPFEESPKVLLATNYILRGSDTSSKRRRWDLELADHYNDKNTPVKEFGKEFFTEWNKQEWNAFYMFMSKCVQLYLDKGIIKMDTEGKLAYKTLVADTSEDFLHFMEEHKEEFTEKFSLEFISKRYSSYSTKSMPSKRMKQWLTKWCAFYGYSLEEKRKNNRRYYSIKENILSIPREESFLKAV
jgi:hypothetical protein